MGWSLWSLPSVPPAGSSEVSAPSPLEIPRSGWIKIHSLLHLYATSIVDPRLAVEIHQPPRGLPKLADSHVAGEEILFLFISPSSHLSSTPCLSSFPRMGLRQYKLCLDVFTTSSHLLIELNIFSHSNLALSYPLTPRTFSQDLHLPLSSFWKILFANNLITVHFITLHFVMEFMYNHYNALVSLPTPSTITNPQPSSCSSCVHS